MKSKLQPGLLTLLLLIPCFLSFSQETKSYSFSGNVVDSISGKALEYVTVVLKSSEKKPLKTLLTSPKGEFFFEKIAAGNYILSVVSVGYKSQAIQINTIKDSLVKYLGIIKLSKLDNQLKEVTITGDRPMIKQEIDRISYDVQADPENKVNTVLDMLRKVPLVSIDADDNIEVKGSSSFKVLINGRPSSLVARSPKDVFKSMPASNIQRIEVITTPPAKYDGEGLAGIINIITNKKVDQGYNGTVSTRYNFPNGPGANLNFTAKGKKIGISAHGGGGVSEPPGTNFSMSRIIKSDQSSLTMDGDRENVWKYMYSNAELSYELDSLNLVTAEFGYNNGTGEFNTFQHLIQSGTADYKLSNLNESSWNGFDVGLNYQLGFKRNKEQLLTGSYKFTRNKDERLSDFFALDMPDYQNYGQNNESGTDEQTVQLDYLHPVGKLNIEGGIKMILRDNFSDYEYGNYSENHKESEYTVDAAKSNIFNYRQNIFGYYNSYQFKLKDWGFKAGLRLERTVIDADFVSLNTPLKTDYNNFIPSISVQRKFKKGHSLNLGYTQRIQRPGIWQLNPFEERFNDNFTRSGNKDLKPVLNHNIDLGYSFFKKSSLNAGLNYSFANNTIQYVNRLDGNISRATFENIGKNKSFGFNINANRQITKNFNLNMNGRLSYVFMEGEIDGKVLENDGVQGNFYLYAGYKLKKDWRIGLNAGYYSAWITLQGQSNPYYYTSASVNKEFLKKKVTFSVSVNNPFQKFRSWRNETSSDQFIQVESFQNHYRTYNASLSYKFGSLKGAIKKNKRGINNDDVSGKSSPN